MSGAVRCTVSISRHIQSKGNRTLQSIQLRAHYKTNQGHRLLTCLSPSSRPLSCSYVYPRPAAASRHTVLPAACAQHCWTSHWNYQCVAPYSTSHHRLNQVQPKPDQDKDLREDDKPEPPAQSLGILQRFHKAYKEYGKILVGVHLATSAVWLGSFYYAAASGLDIVPLLESMGAGETILKPFKSTGVGNIAVAYLLYKLATPARYTVTIVGTQQTAKYLKKTGYIKPIAEEDKFRSLMKEGSDKVKTRVQKEARDRREKFQTRVDEQKDKLQERKYLLEQSVRRLKKRQGIGYARRKATKKEE